MASTTGWIGGKLRAVGSFVRRRPLFTLMLLPAAALAYVLVLIPFTPSIGDIKKAKQEQPTVVLSADGKELATFQRANRDWVKLQDIAPAAIAALLATEDHRFYDHHGIDVVRTAKAAVNTLKGDRQGGSTLTQQLARNLYPEEIGRAPTITRKIKEAITALKIEAVYSKDEILETYLNSVSFLYNAWGIEMAARTYFDKPARKLNELEAATLVGMLKGTSFYNPVLNPERALDRRNTVLAQMVKHGKLPQARFAKLKEQPLKLDFERLPETNGMAPHMARYLRNWLIDWADRNDYNIYADGLVVRTTIDSRLQEFANEAVKKKGDQLQAVADVEWSRSSLPSYGTEPSAYVSARSKAKAFDYFWNSRKDLVDTFVRESGEYRNLVEQGMEKGEALSKLKGDEAFMAALRRSKTTLQAGFLAIDPNTGQIRAWVGSRDWKEDKFDHVQQARRQPGSTFKPFVYGAAFEQGIHPNETLMDAPVDIQIDKNKVWRPGDVGAGPTHQPMTLREALARSKNTITAQLMMRVGPSRVASLARAMGVRESKLEEVPSLALGTSPVTLKEMVASFGTIANGGSYMEPVLVTRVEDRNGNVLEAIHPSAPEPGLANDAALTLLDVLRGTIDFGSAVSLRHRFDLKGDLAGKTGTTQDNTDGWFILMHPQLVAGAWVGFNDSRVAMRSEYWGQGSHNALLLVGDFMQSTLKKGVVDPSAKFAAPRQGQSEPPIFQRMNDWWNSVFSSPAPADTEVAATPPVRLEPPLLEPPPATPLSTPSPLPMPYPADQLPLPPPPPAVAGQPSGNLMVPSDAPVVAERVPSFPRPLEPARPSATVPGTQVYPLPESAKAPALAGTPDTATLGAGPSGSGSSAAPSSTWTPPTSSVTGKATPVAPPVTALGSGPGTSSPSSSSSSSGSKSATGSSLSSPSSGSSPSYSSSSTGSSPSSASSSGLATPSSPSTSDGAGTRSSSGSTWTPPSASTSSPDSGTGIGSAGSASGSAGSVSGGSTSALGASAGSTENSPSPAPVGQATGSATASVE